MKIVDERGEINDEVVESIRELMNTGKSEEWLKVGKTRYLNSVGYKHFYEQEIIEKKPHSLLLPPGSLPYHEKYIVVFYNDRMGYDFVNGLKKGDRITSISRKLFYLTM